MDNLNLALNMIFTGVSVVFLCLVLLVFVIYAMPKVLSVFYQKKINNVAVSDSRTVREENGIELNQSKQIPINQKKECNDELLAVITAAVLACFKPEVRSRIRIASFRRVSDTPPVWNGVSRNEQIASKYD